MKKALLTNCLLVFTFISQAQIVNIPDANFKTALHNYQGGLIDANHDNEIQLSEAQAVNYLHFSSQNNQSMTYISSQTSNLTGIEAFINLIELELPAIAITSFDATPLNNLIALQINGATLNNLNVSGMTNLVSLTCISTGLTSLNVNTLTNLQELNCGLNNITSLDVSALTNLTLLNCNYNQLHNLDLTNLTNLNYLHCSNNNLTSLDLTDNVSLVTLLCHHNQLTDLNIADAPFLKTIECNNNLFTSLDFSNTALFLSNEVNNNSHLYLSANPNLTFVNLKIGHPFISGYVVAGSCPNLHYVCTDPYNINYINQSFVTAPNVNIGSYCNFVPGGSFNTITGNFNFDFTGGCSESSGNNPAQFQITLNDGTTTGSTFSNAAGNYTFYTQDGSFILTPSTGNDYFTFTPPTATVTFADSSNNTQTQNFCVIPNGVHYDLDIIILPIQNARPGFNCNYRLIYKNKGNQTMDGNINLYFNDAVFDFVDADPATASQSPNNLNWNFTGLKPFESRSIGLTLNLNGPTETPAVNIDDVLHFVATIYPIQNDETPDDNIFPLDQTVRGALDPNDKICLEGNTITPAMVGDYLHYVIRFQNTGTYFAENVVVKDIIDATKFDISSLQLTDSSHPNTTRVTGNKIEFIFEDINLPATIDDEPASHGFVAFKIKTKNNLVLGNSVENTADIYFDYNFPVVTNTASTTVALLNVNEIENKTISITPIPVTDILHITALDTITSVQVFDIQGRLLQSKTNNNTEAALDFSGKAAGVYLVKVYTAKGMKIQKVIKQ